MRESRSYGTGGGGLGQPMPLPGPSHLKRVHVNARIQKWMLDELKRQGEVGIVLEYILEKKQVLSISLKKKIKIADF